MLSGPLPTTWICYISTMEEDKQDKRKNGDDLEDLLTEAAQQTAHDWVNSRETIENIGSPKRIYRIEELNQTIHYFGEYVAFDKTAWLEQGQ